MSHHNKKKKKETKENSDLILTLKDYPTKKITFKRKSKYGKIQIVTQKSHYNPNKKRKNKTKGNVIITAY